MTQRFHSACTTIHSVNTRPQNKVNSLQRADIWYNGLDDFFDNYATNRKIFGAQIQKFQNPQIEFILKHCRPL